MKKFLKPTSLALFIILTLVPFQWVTLLTVSGLSLKPVHISLALAVSVAVFEKKRVAWRGLFLGYGSLFVWLYGLYVLWYCVSILWAGDQSLILPFLAKQIVYFVCFLVFSLLVFKLVRRGDFTLIAGWAALLGTFLFAAYMVAVFALEGQNLIAEYYKAIIEMDERTLLFRFYPLLFNYFQSDVTYLTSLRNAVMGVIIMYMVLLLTWRRTLESRFVKMLATAGVVICIALVVTSISRSNIIIMGGIFLLPLLMKISWENLQLRFQRKTVYAALLTIVVLLIAVALVWISSESFLTAMTGILAARLTQIASDPRIGMYENALDAIYHNLFLGYGIGKEIADSRGLFFTVHNVFLASWVETGLVGAILSLAWYAAILVDFLRVFLACHTWKHRASLEWAIALPVLPLFRILVSGSGKFTLTDWLSLALFYGIMRGIQKNLLTNSEIK